jgi:hypothetical protein
LRFIAIFLILGVKSPTKRALNRKRAR